MLAAVIAVGSELLGTERLDTNSLRLAALLERYGCELRRKAVVGDSETELVLELESLLGRFDLVLVTGGLGPTADDITRPAVAAALGRGTSLDPTIVEAIRERFRRIGRPMAEVNRRQAEVIDGAEVLANERGTAPGLQLVEERTTIFLFPGVPFELEWMMDVYLEPWLAARTGDVQQQSVVLRVSCVAEATLEEWISPAYAELGRESITVLAKPGEIEVRATARGSARERWEKLSAASRRLRELIGDALYGEGEEASLEATVGELLTARGATLVTAESCTGGGLAERLTRVAGSSRYFLGGAVSYSNELKTRLLGVDPALITAEGAVSLPVAEAMARGARERLGADYALAVTGVAGPDGGTEAKPVGTVHLALAGPDEPAVEALLLTYPSERRRVRWMASQVALEMLRRRLLGLPALQLR